MEFDYYSLGVVLLEIAEWKPLSILTSPQGWRKLSPERFRMALIKEAKSLQHEQTVGLRYCKAMVACLTGNFEISEFGEDEVSDSTEGRSLLHMEFQKLVVDQLAGCSA